MSWFAQVLHVFVKDVRAQRWLLVLFVGSLVLSAVMALSVGRPGDLAEAARQASATITYDASSVAQPSQISEESMMATSIDGGTVIELTPVGGTMAELLVPIIALFLSALIVLADHPLQPRAQWASLPYERSAIWGAKLGFVFALIAMIALAQSVPLLMLQLPVADIPARLSWSAFSMLMFCTVALLLASASPDLRTVLFLVVLLFVASTISELLLPSPDVPWDVPRFVRVLSAPLVMLVAAGWLYFMYRVRPRATGARAASFVLAGLISPALALITTPPEVPLPASKVIPGASISSRLEAQRNPAGDSLTLIWQLQSSGIPSTMRAVQYSSRYANSIERECASMHLTLPIQYGTLQAPPVPLDSMLRWPVGAPPTVNSLSFSHNVLYGRTDTRWARCASRGWLSWLELSDAMVFAELPLRTGARHTQRGQRVVISDAEFNGSNRVASVVTFSVRGGTLCSFGRSTYALVNRVEREAVLLQTAHERSGFFNTRCTHRFILSLADSSGRETSWAALGRHTPEASAAWLRDAELVVIEWRSRGTVSITPTAAEGAP